MAFTGVLVCMTLSASAQENIRQELKTTSQPSAVADEVYYDNEPEYLNGMVPIGALGQKMAECDSLPSTERESVADLTYNRRWWWFPYMGGFSGWHMHEGLNVSLGLSAFTSFGGNAFSGWGQNLSATYVKPLNDRWTIAVGAFLTNYSTNLGTARAAGVAAMVNYRINEHWQAFVYGQKAFVDNNMSLPYFCYGPYGAYQSFLPGYPYHPLAAMGMMGDRIGAGVCWQPNDKFSVSLQMEYHSMPNSFHRNLTERWEMPNHGTAP